MDIAQPSLKGSSTPAPSVSASVGGVAERKTEEKEGAVEMLDGPDAAGSGAGAGDATGREGLRQRVVAGGDGGGGGGQD